MNISLLFTYFYSFFSHPFSLFIVKVLALVFKLFLLGMLLRFRTLIKTRVPLGLLMGLFLIFNMIVDFSWLLKLLREAFFPAISYPLVVVFLRIGLLCSIVEYSVLAMLIDYTLNPENRQWTLRQKIMFFCSGFLLCAQAMVVLFAESLDRRSEYEFFLYNVIYFYLFALLGLALYCAFKKIHSDGVPKILKAQFKTFIKWMIVPGVVLEFVALGSFMLDRNYRHGIYAFTGISTVILTYALYFSARRIIKLRFLNMRNHVETVYGSNFIRDFKDVLEQLVYIDYADQIGRVVITFFEKTVQVLPGKTFFYVRHLLADSRDLPQQAGASCPILEENQKRASACVENMLLRSLHAERFRQFLYQTKILIRDEIEFTNFYEQDAFLEVVLDFLNSLSADIFIPIYEKKNMLGYIIIARDARPQMLFGVGDRDEMLIFSSYISKTLSTLQHGNFNTLVKEKKELKEELYQKHGEIGQYKESLRYFLRSAHERKIGIVFYKNRRFGYGNQSAQEILGFDPNIEQGRELAKALKKIVHDVQKYKSHQTLFSHDLNNNKLVIVGIPGLDAHSAVLTVYYPEIADIVRKNLDCLKDPTEWDYMLYLETTRSGQLINQLMPGSSETILNFKIKLLKAALGRKAVLLDVPEDDLLPIVEIVHHISLRSELYTINLCMQEKNCETGLKIFGVNPLFYEDKGEQSLLEKLNTTGTLFIKNVDLLSIETQKSLAEFIRYGVFKPIKGDQKITGDVRIICSSPKNLKVLVQKGLFAAELFQELTRTVIQLPVLIYLPANELRDIMDGYIEQILQKKELKNLLELNEKDRLRIINQKPISFHELKEHISCAFVKKSHKKKIEEISVVGDSFYADFDSDVNKTICLGKRALKDMHAMNILWGKFKNQAKIAQLLGVNRSSVNRRCKEYNLI